MSNYKIGVNLRVTENSNQGGRKYMEDNHAIRFEKNTDGGFEFAYFGIFDGHGGGEASKFAREHLLCEITKYDSFRSENDDDVLEAIRSGFLDTHYAMWKEVDKWPRTLSGMQSTSGTTASIAIIKNSKLYIGHVGDSGVALGYDESTCEKFIRPRGAMLTVDHKPDCPVEKKRIEECGGQVVSKSGVQRVVWNRPKVSHKGPIRRSTPIDRIPFLAVARSLGDLWSYNYLNEQFVVSPEPDVSVHTLDPNKDKCLIFGSDGLWNMVSAEEAVSMVVDLEYQFEYKVINDPNASVSYWINPAEKLVNRALNKWRSRLMKADNTSCVVVLIDPLGPRKLSILKKKREEHFKKLREEKTKAAESVKANSVTRTSPRKSHETCKKSDKPESPIVPQVAPQKNSPPKIMASPCKDKGKQTKVSGAPIIDNVMDLKPAVSPVSHEKAKRQSLPGHLVGEDLDDSIQATSVHKKLTFTPLSEKNEDETSQDYMNSLTTAHNMATVDVSPMKKAIVNSTDVKNVNRNSLLCSTKNSPIKLSLSTRTRQRHFSNPCTGEPLKSTEPVKEKRPVSSHDAEKPTVSLSKVKRAHSLPVLTEYSQKQQNSNRQSAMKEHIDMKYKSATRSIFDTSHMDLRVKSSFDCNRGTSLRHQNSTNIHIGKEARVSIASDSQQVKKLGTQKNVKSVFIRRKGLRRKKGQAKGVRSSSQAENKHFVTRTRLGGVKRKTELPAELMPVTKRLCRS